ncbi:DNA-3-methyladenine glycosylase 2 family protein [Enterovirga sp.]|uniref:DNA-3-methyladenine glycosylase family protein n=1 Tax=Enterovirga sp. TaxID=2026350 RepID=UPI002D10DE70|nr:DNA-3-methyladenine glycosylase 2 family protein [Enterovirga sp.]HMO30996.1 DNA-3-methyladenine glycosylase 2 family protein [Enterovirga sp.]
MARRLILDSPDAMARGARALARRDPLMRRLARDLGPPPLRRHEPGFPGLVRIVVGQQLSIASAAAIWTRCLAELAPLTAEAVAAASEERLRAAGLSRPKMRTLRALAAAVEGGALPLDSLHEHEADSAHRLLTGVSGIGPWTADIYLLFCLGHADAFAAGDLALQEAARDAAGLDARPNAAALLAMAENWRPWRGVAAGLLWAHYRRIKTREGILAA